MSFRLSRHTRAQLVLDEIDANNSALSEADRERKYAKMAESPYKFFRGTNHLYWRDVWYDWRYHLFGGVRETQTWLQGDAHVYNHGAYGHHGEALRYGMDDFDDAVVADYQYDLWRHAASMVLDTRENVGLTSQETRRAIRHLLNSYLDELGAHANGEEAASIDIDNTEKPLGPFMEKVARKQGRQKQLEKWTVVEDGQRRFNTEKKKMAGVAARTRNQIAKALETDYLKTLDGAAADKSSAHFQIKDIVRRMDAGIGSLGMLRYYVLIEGPTQADDDDIILDVKQQGPPQAWHFMNTKEKRDWRQAFANEGERHAAAFRALADHPDDYLGWLKLGDKDFSVRERSPFKKDFPTHKLDKLKDYRRLAKQWGRSLAREHIRGARALQPDDPGFFCQAVLARCEPRREAFKKLVGTLAFSYAQCVTQDHEAFVAERVPQ